MAKAMDSQHQHQLNVTFLPYPTPGHMNPMIDTARLFAKHGVNVTIIATPANALTFQNAIDSDFSHGYHIRTQLLPFPAAQVGLPEGVENIKDGTSLELLGRISRGISMLKGHIELLFQDLHPDCIVSDMSYPWTVESAAELGIPRIFFYSSSYLSDCASHFVMRHRPHERLVSDTEKFSIPGFPHRIEMTPLQLANWQKVREEVSYYFEGMFASERRSYGAIYNSFHELESEYEQLHKSIVGIKSWSIGPVSAWVNKDDDGQKINREHKEDLPGEPELHHAQLVELAYGLENSGHSFIWIIRKKDANENEYSFLQEFEDKMKESKKGFIIWNWAPQLLILNHPAIGGIVSHCGWNSLLESLSAGLPVITWPMFAEQFYNEKLVVDVLKVGVSVGTKENKFWALGDKDDVVERVEITKAVLQLMETEEGREMRRRAIKLGDASKKTIEKGGHSYNNLIQLIDELKSLKISKALAETS
ncbi:hypothetical protein V8G54_021138 [Vigna mungo]|uniref:Glycosyltransferase n=1 Tax=Vigna mungo TaxID=3915 RepID=A0AAQ3NF86_VIGMU